MIEAIWRNDRGAYIIAGIIGIRQYYGFSKAESKRLYLQECERTVIVNQKKEVGKGDKTS